MTTVEELQALCDAASPAPWEMVGEHHAGHMIGAFIRTPTGRIVAYIDGDEDVAYVASTVHDAEFIAAARTALPALLARLRAAEETLAAVGAVLAAKEAELRASTLLPTALVESAIRSGGYKLNAHDIRAALAEGASR